VWVPSRPSSPHVAANEKPLAWKRKIPLFSRSHKNSGHGSGVEYRLNMSTTFDPEGGRRVATLEEIREAAAALPKADKARLLVSVATDLGDASPGIAFDPAVCGGDARITHTRIPVWTLEAARREGLSEAEILAAFPTLKAEDLVNAWAYVRTHREEIEREIQENEAD
jgi:uncharacterized protein (DUF433 family)